MNKCMDCGKELSSNPTAKRCKNCDNKRKNKTKIIKTCIDCGKEIDRRSKRCSVCCGKIMKITRIGEGNPSYKGIGNLVRDLKYYCVEINCNNQISYENFISGKKRCQSCAMKDRFKNPKNVPAYINGLSREPYPLKWNKRFKESIRKRDDYTCQYCGMTQEEHFEKYGRNIEVHHIDYNRYNCKENNLITLCKIDNIKANTNRDYWFTYYKYIMEKIKC